MRILVEKSTVWHLEPPTFPIFLMYPISFQLKASCFEFIKNPKLINPQNILQALHSCLTVLQRWLSQRGPVLTTVASSLVATNRNCPPKKYNTQPPSCLIQWPFFQCQFYIRVKNTSSSLKCFPMVPQEGITQLHLLLSPNSPQQALSSSLP